MEVSGQFHTRAALLPGKAAKIYRVGGWLSPRAYLDVSEWEKSLVHYRESNKQFLGYPASSLVTATATLFQFPPFLYFKLHIHIVHPSMPCSHKFSLTTRNVVHRECHVKNTIRTFRHAHSLSVSLSLSLSLCLSTCPIRYIIYR